MRNFLNNNYYFSQKGQALVELATFGTVLLFCLAMLINFGLQANYQQELEMKAFRQAMRQSYNNDNRGPNAGAEANLIEDKVGISTQDAYGVSERYTSGAGARVTWNNNLMDDFVDEEDNPRYAYLPQTNFQINRQNYAYTTADFRNYPCSGSITVRVPDLTDADRNGVYWRDVSIDCATQTKVLEEELAEDIKIKVGYIKNISMGVDKQPINSADVDGDGKQELVVKVEGEVGNPIQSFVVVDSQEGQMDTTIEMTHNPDGSNKVAEFANRRQGLLPNYTKTITKTGILSKTEDKTGITTTTNATSTEIITRQIRLNNGGIVDVKTKDPLYTEKNITWTTPK